RGGGRGAEPSRFWEVTGTRVGPNVCRLPLILGGIWEEKCAIKRRRAWGPPIPHHAHSLSALQAGKPRVCHGVAAYDGLPLSFPLAGEYEGFVARPSYMKVS